jgi:hypothetical protein
MSSPAFIPDDPQQSAQPAFIPDEPSSPAVATPTAPAPPAAPQPGNLDDVNSGAEVTKGQIKGVGRTLAGLLNIYSKLPGGPMVPTDPGVQALAGRAADWINQHTVLRNPAQEQGNVEESLAEMLLPGIGEETSGVKASEMLGGLAERAKMLEKFGDIHALAKVGLDTLKGAASGATRGAVEQGAQTFVKTGGQVQPTEQAAATGAAFGGVAGSVLSGGATALQRAAQRVEELRPGTAAIAGARFQTDPETGNLLLRGDLRQDPASQAVEEAAGNMAKTAVANSANRINDVREAVAGPEPVITSRGSPPMTIARARKQLGMYNRILDNDSLTADMSNRAVTKLQADADDLDDQIGNYNVWAANQPSYPALDAVDAQRNTNSLKDAASILNSHYNDALMNARTPDEAAAAHSGLEDATALNDLHDFINSKFGAVSPEEEARSIARGGQLQRTFTPGAGWNQQLDNFFDTGNNRAALQRTIGPEHMDSLKEMGTMFNNADSAQQAANLRTSIVSQIRRHFSGVRGMLAGGAGFSELLAHEVARGIGVGSLPVAFGTYAGIRDYVTDRLITDPDFLQRFSYAVQRNLPPRTAGPILAAHILTRLGATPLNAPQQQGGQ